MAPNRASSVSGFGRNCPPMTDAPELLADSPSVRVAVWGGYVITVVASDADVEALEVFRDTFAPIKERFPDGHWSVTVLEGLPRSLVKPKGRAAVREIMEQYASRVRASALVIEGDERYLVAVRGMINLLSRALTHAHESRVEAKITEGLAWLAERGAPEHTPELIGVVNMVRPGTDLADAAFW